MKTFHFHKDYVLENDRVLLRPLTEDDTKHLLTFSENEPELWTYSLLPANGKDNLKKYISIALENKDDETAYPFIVFDKQTNQYAGSTRFYDIQQYHETLQLGYTWYGKAFQGTGLNKQCKFLMLQFAFNVMEIKRVEFRADATNARSIAAMKRIGCTVEGILRSNCKSVADRRDSIVLSILKSEWDSHIRENLKLQLDNH